MTLRIYNTLSREKEPFSTLQPGVVHMYVCGPTVYDKAHVGHAMSALVFDMVRRYLTFKGYRVIHAMNFTDVDDKIINRSHELREDPFALAERYINEFLQLMQELGVLPATYYPRVSEVIPQIIAMVKGLQEKGFAYEVEGSVYFRVRRFPAYGKLSGRKMEDALSGTRITSSEGKEDINDFALWKAAKPGEPSWASPWGKGRPGWHIECSAMCYYYLGEQIDIHGGGNDLIFPHHENEIAQTEAFTGKLFARYWMHNGMLQLRGEKMSKSVGNLITIDAFLAEHEADVLRMIVLSSHYRKPLAFGEQVIADNERALARLRSALRPGRGQVQSGTAVNALHAQMDATRAGFEAAMDDDFNSAGALGNLFNLVKAINAARDAGVSSEILGTGQDMLRSLAGVLGLRLATSANDHEVDAGPFIDLLLSLRQLLRGQKQYVLADQLRDDLTRLGVVVEDSAAGSSWRWAA